MSIKETITKIKNKETTITALTIECLENIKKAENLNAFITLNTDAILQEAKRLDETLKGNNMQPLTGIIFCAKDNIHVAGLPSTAGTPALKNFYPRENAPLVSKLYQAGALAIGKTNMHELAFGITGYNHAFYKDQIGCRNAYDSSKFAGGSSSGSAVAVATGGAMFALGTDTGGSVRIPAALNNLVGFRPTIGRYSKAGVCPISHTRDTIGFITKTVEDVIYLDNIVTGGAVLPATGASTPMASNLLSLSAKPSISNPTGKPASILPIGRDIRGRDIRRIDIRLGLDESQSLANASEGVKKNWQETKEKLKHLDNIELVNINLSEIYRLNSLVSFPVALYEANDDLIAYLREYKTGINIEQLVTQIASPDVEGTYKQLVLPRKLPSPDGSLVEAKPIYEQAIREHRPNLINTYKEIFIGNKLDAIIAPATVSEALDAVSDTTTPEIFGLFIQNTDPTSNAGFPSISIPMGKTEAGLPVGLLIDGLANNDSKLLTIAKQLSQQLNVPAIKRLTKLS